jgi:type IV pilus assembly protein PilE
VWCKKVLKQSGFTLVEVMVTVVIIGILLTVALPSYQDYVKQGKRAEAQQYLLQQANKLERDYTRQGSYPASFDPSDPPKDYTFSYVSIDNTNTGFTLSAVPKEEDDCGTLSINHQGSTQPVNCW